MDIQNSLFDIIYIIFSLETAKSKILSGVEWRLMILGNASQFFKRILKPGGHIGFRILFDLQAAAFGGAVL